MEFQVFDDVVTALMRIRITLKNIANSDADHC